ncbi:MAG TPA: ATP-binding cassette domain-containing protein, partial [Casimicrobiaceae bacterium]
MATSDVPLLELAAVTKRFVKPLDMAMQIGNFFGAHAREEVVHAVDDVDLAIADNEVVGLVGESGCGKSTLGRLISQLIPVTSGEVILDGVDITKLSGE